MGNSVLKGLSLEGTVTVVTGSGSGLGKQMALAIAGAGGDIVLAGRRPQPLRDVFTKIQSMGTRAVVLPTDVTDTTQVRNLFKTAIHELGHVDALINNAGMVGDQGGVPIWEISDEDWHSVMDANLSSAFYCSRAVVPHMVERGSGKIVNVLSGFGLRGGRDNYMYACSKGGVIQLTRVLATSLGRYGITTNCIVPGYFPTEGTATSRESLPSAKFVPVGRVGDPKELGSVAVFLVSQASGYMNGEMFAIDGGGLAGGYAPTGHAPDIPLDSQNSNR